MGASSGYTPPQYDGAQFQQQFGPGQAGSPSDSPQQAQMNMMGGPASMKGGGTVSPPNYQQMAGFAGGQPGPGGMRQPDPAMMQQMMQQRAQMMQQAQPAMAQPAMAPPPVQPQVSPQQQQLAAQRATMNQGQMARNQQRVQAFQQRPGGAANPLQQQMMRAQALRAQQ